MREKPDAEKNRAADLTPATRFSTPWRVAAVEALPKYRLRVTFVDGTRGIADFSGLARRTKAAGVFAALADPEFFAKVHVDHGAVTWPGELDVAPDAMYDAIKAHGEWRSTSAA